MYVWLIIGQSINLFPFTAKTFSVNLLAFIFARRKNVLINYFLRRLKLATFVEKKKFPVSILEKTTKDNLLSTDLLIEKNSQILKLFFATILLHH